MADHTVRSILDREQRWPDGSAVGPRGRAALARIRETLRRLNQSAPAQSQGGRRSTLPEEERSCS
jgi:hypothetical protein